jgi:chaperone required for assembly of F1-ATPase
MSDKPDPLKRPRRFYKAAATAPAGDGFAVLLDGRPVKTPAGGRLVAPTQALAQLLADEWDAQAEHIDMQSMPAVRLAATAIDRVSQARVEVAAEIARYAGADVLCYFAERPQALVERQVQAWGPVLDWAAEALDVHLTRVVGIVHHEQPVASLLRVALLAEQADDFGLAGLAHATGLFGSAVLAFAVQRDKLGGETAFDLSHLDAAVQAEFWGEDAEAAERVAAMRAEAVMLERWFAALAAG